jgi:hypothetical protein
MRMLCVAVAIAIMSVAPALAMPTAPVAGIADAEPQLLVDVATKSQKAYGYRSCKRKYGSRLAYVSYRGSNYVCHYRKSTKTLTKAAARSCRKSGMKLQRVTSIKIKGNRSVTRFVCVR